MKQNEREEKKDILISLATKILSLEPGAHTLDIFSAPSFPLPKREEKEMQEPFKLLQHASTLVNKAHRKQDKNGHYLAQTEDYINAMGLIEKITQEKQA